jgi:CRISPR/Cas system-associated protein Cas7 (RAMP superfamily)
MSTRNPWLKFQRLLQGEGRAVLTVVSNNGDGTSTVQTRNGVQIKVKGEGLGATAQAMIEGGELRYEVPSLASSVVEV